MSGENESKKLTVKEQLAAFEKSLDEYEGRISLLFPKCQPIVIEQALNLTDSDIAMMDEEECGIKAHALAQYSLYLQKELNRNNIRINWAKEKLNALLGQKYDSYGDKYTKYEAKLAMLCADNAYAAELNNIVLHAQARTTAINNVTMHISLICSTLTGLQNSKRGKRYDSARTH